VHADQEQARVRRAQLIVRLKDVIEAEHRAEARAPGFAEKVVADLGIDHRAHERVGGRDARAAGEPEAGRRERGPVVRSGKRPQARAERERNRSAAAFRNQIRIERRLTFTQPDRARLELDAERRCERVLDRG
jgi:hypothetical protein